MDKATPTLRQRCDTALQSLPDAPYRAMLAALFDEMLAEVERLAAQAAPTKISEFPEDYDGLAHLYIQACEERDHLRAVLAAQPSQAPVVQAGEYPPLPEELFSEFWGCVAVWDLSAEGEEAGAEAIRIENVVKGLMRAYVDADRASSGATTAQAVYVPRLLTALEICRQYPDFDADTAIGTMLDAAIKGEPNEMLDLVSPHTGAAQAVRMLTKEELTDLIASTVAALTKGQP